MSKANSRWRVSAAIALTAWMVAVPVRAQTPGGTAPQQLVLPRNLIPLTTAAEAAAIDSLARQTQPPQSRPRRSSCGKRAAIGLAVGAGAGFATAGALLASTGGSDETYQILFNFTGFGAGVGALLGLGACSR